MKSGEVKVNYLYNSSFKVETENYILIFDYFNEKSEGSLESSSAGVVGEEDLNSDKTILVFATHSHGDHFSEVIFTWSKERRNIEYILSSDIQTELGSGKVNIISPYEKLTVKGAEIKAFGSTDLGVSLLIGLDGISLFHAGDLNWWHWYDESEEFNRDMEKAFKLEIEKLIGENIDLAFFPVDPRLKESYYLGPEYFIEMLKPEALVPMHFREDFYITEEFAAKNKDKETVIFTINKRGQQITYKKP